MAEILSVGAGGFLGSVARYVLTKVLARATPYFPAATLVSNAVAGLLIGLIIGLERQNGLLEPRVKLFLTTGMMGGLSTFSTFSIETVNLFQAGKFFVAFLNIAANLGISLLLAAVGLRLAKCF